MAIDDTNFGPALVVARAVIVNCGRSALPKTYGRAASPHRAFANGTQVHVHAAGIALGLVARDVA